MNRPTKNKQKKQTGSLMRGRLLESYGVKASHASTMTLSFSLKMRKDMLIPGGLGYLHFLITESDPEVVAVNYSPIVPSISDAKNIRRYAEILNKDGSLILRSVASTESEYDGNTDAMAAALAYYRARNSCSVGKYKSVHARVLVKNDIERRSDLWLRNWFELMPWYEGAARYHNLAAAKSELNRLMEINKTVSFEFLTKSSFQRTEAQLVVAAAIEGVANGVYKSNLSEVQFGSGTKLYLPEER